MAHPSMGPISVLAVLTLLVRLTHAAFSQSYCSSENTGTEYPVYDDDYQSNGLCHDRCNVEGYALAVVQYQSCWCSDYLPRDQLSVGDCNTGCPGYADEEKCGNPDKRLFGYVSTDKAPKSQEAPAPAPAPTSSQEAPPMPIPDKETVINEQTVTAVVTSTVISSQNNPPPSSVKPSSSSTSAPEPETLVSYITNEGVPTPVTQVVTEFITPTEAASSQATGEQTGNTSDVSGGTIAGAVVGGVAGIGAIAGLAFMLLRRRQRSDEIVDDDKGSIPRRNVSTLSKVGLLRSRSLKDPSTPVPPVPAYRQGSSHGKESTNSGQASPAPERERRNSRPMFYDQRLNPSALMSLDNGSHNSILTLEDNRDYGRTFTVTNPDPHPHPQ